MRGYEIEWKAPSGRGAPQPNITAWPISEEQRDTLLRWGRENGLRVVAVRDLVREQLAAAKVGNEH